MTFYIHFNSFCKWCGFLFLLGISVEAESNSCDVSKCLSPQLADATKSKDMHTICRLLTPSLHCMEMKLPSCTKSIGEDSMVYKTFESQLDKLKVQYAEKCHAVYTTCTEFAKCLRPDLQKAAHHEDVQSLCKDAPVVINCFESAIHKCQAKTGHRDVNFELIESKLEELRHRTASRCDGTSLIVERRTSPLVLAMLITVFFIHCISQGLIS